MDAYEFLKNDHQEVSQLFDKVEKTTNVEKRRKLFLELKTELELHAFVEEKIFYLELKKAAESRGTALEGYEEHRVIQRLLEELEELSADREQWDAKLTVLKEVVEHHVEEEEGEMFRHARQVLSSEKAEEIGARMATEKAKEKATI